MADVSNLIKMVYISNANYIALTTKDSNTLYFIKDTNKIYRGTQDYTNSVRVVNSFPESNQAQGILYVNASTSEAKTWNGSTWVTVVRPVDTTVTENSTNLITSGAVYDAIDDAIGDIDFSDFVTNISWDNTNKKLKVYKDDEEVPSFQVELDKIATDIDYDGSTGVITLKDVKGATLKTINIPLDNFVASGTYDATTQSIILTLQNANTVTIPVSALVNIYYGSTTATAITTVSTVSGQETIQVAVRISTRANNAIQTISTSGEEGLFVDITGKADKVSGATSGNLAGLDSNGNLTDSGKAAGGATLAGTPDANTLATEAAVSTIAGTKVDKLTGTFAANDIATITATGGIQDSGKTIGGATLAATPSSNTLATEAAVKDYADTLGNSYVEKTSINTDLTTGTPTDAQVASAAAVVDLMSWTIVPDTPPEP